MRCGVATVNKESNGVLLAEQWGRRQAAMVMDEEEKSVAVLEKIRLASRKCLGCLFGR